jgi:hypothetical protein
MNQALFTVSIIRGDDTRGVEKYKQIEKVQWTESEVLSGKLIKIKNFPTEKKVKLFRVTVSANRRSYVVTNDLNQSDITDVIKICSQRWKLEDFHRNLNN